MYVCKGGGCPPIYPSLAHSLSTPLCEQDTGAEQPTVNFFLPA